MGRARMKLRSRAGCAASALLAALAVLLVPWCAAADDDAEREALAQRGPAYSSSPKAPLTLFQSCCVGRT